MPNQSTTLRDKLSGLSFSFRIARRYLFSKKSHNAINIISGISATGVGVGTMALVCVLSVFNGFESLIADMFSTFDPDLKITLAEGKNFDVNSPELNEVRKLKSVAYFTEVVEENALLRFKDKQMPATIKGVSDDFSKMTRIDSIMYDGKFQLYDGAFQRAVPGVGVASILGLGAHFIDPLIIYAPKRTGKINLLRPETSFNQIGTFISGIFSVKQLQYDDHYVLVSISLARELFEYDKNKVTSVELKLTSPLDQEKVQKQIQAILGDRFQVKNRYEQQESFFKIMQIEKWITYLILCFILLIASFNIIGSLSMLIIDKKADIETLRDLGANNQLIKHIFLFEGWLIAAVGALGGIGIGAMLCLLQEHFGFLKLGSGYVVDAYPVVTNWLDMVLVFVTVLTMGFLAAYYPVRYIRTKEKTLE
ncbi:MAG: ABC transporter permease [Paludibacter sp.]|jgi:ABC-type lipoprotein release transport system permease subunit|nr:ABC transporter permease [Paludibacter sp.]